ncbi:MAG: conserved hypothetical protein partial [Methanobrevibacter sp. CfCl-M3]
MKLYSSYGGAVYQGTPNLFTANITGDQNQEMTATLYANDQVVNNTTVNLVSGENNIINILDPTIRAINNNSFNTGNNVTYNLTLSNSTDSVSIVKSISSVYNGYLGKKYSPTGDDSVMEKYNINGDILVDPLNYSTYLGTNQNSRTDTLLLNISKDNIVKTFAYVPYNWANQNFQLDTVKCNNNSITLYKKFSDKSNLGSFGDKEYGVCIYDITDHVKNGNNSLEITKASGSAALYPTVFIALYNESMGSNKEVLINNGADLLSNDYNKLSRMVESTTKFDISKKEDITKATFYSIFSGGEHEDHFDLLFNNNDLEGEIVENHVNSTECCKEDVTKYISDGSNYAVFNNTGNIGLVIPQILVLEHKTGEGGIGVSGEGGIRLPKTGLPLTILLIGLLVSGLFIGRRK